MKQPTNNTTKIGIYEGWTSLGDAIQQVFMSDRELLKKDLQGNAPNSGYVRATNINGLAWAYKHTVTTSRYEYTIDKLVSNAISALSDWMPCDKELIEYMFDYEAQKLNEIIAELVLLATSIEEHHSSAAGWRNDTIVQGLTWKQITLPCVRVYPENSLKKKFHSLLTYVMQKNTFVLDEVERGDILPLQVYCRLAQLVICRMLDCVVEGLVRPSWRCEKHSFRWQLSYTAERWFGPSSSVVRAIDKNEYTQHTFVIPMRNQLIRVLRNTLVRLTEFEKALNDNHIPTWYTTEHAVFYEAFIRKYCEYKLDKETQGQLAAALEKYFIAYANGEDDVDEEDN